MSAALSESHDVTVEPDTGEVTVLLTKPEAVALTAKIQGYFGATCLLVKEAHDKQAWRAMGYGSWAAYCKAEFDYSRSYSYRLIGHVNRILELSAAAGIEAEVSPMGDTLSERATRDLDMGETVEAVEEATADLPADASNEDRLDVAMEAIKAQQAKAKADPEPSPAVIAARARRAAEEAAKTSDSDGDAPSEPSESDRSPGQNDEASTAVDADGADDGNPPPVVEGGEVGPPPDLPATELPVLDVYDVAPLDLHLTLAALFDLDPHEVATRLAEDHRSQVCTLVDDITDWCHRFDQAVLAAHQEKNQ